MARLFGQHLGTAWVGQTGKHKHEPLQHVGQAAEVKFESKFESLQPVQIIRDHHLAITLNPLLQ